MAVLLSLHFYAEDDSWEQGSQYLKLVAVKLDLDSSESPTQTGILHQLDILSVARAKHYGDAQLMHKQPSIPVSSAKIIL